MRWLLLDEIERIERGKRAFARSRVPQGECSPEPLLIEMMAQTGAVLLGAESDYQKDLIFAKIETADFTPPYTSGESVWIETSADAFRPEGAWMDGWVRTQDREIVRGRFLLMHVEGLNSEQHQPITFHPAFMNHFKVRDKIQ